MLIDTPGMGQRDANLSARLEQLAKLIDAGHGGGARLEELASMLRGESRGATTMQEATSMLEAARDFLREPPPRERQAPGRRKADG